MEAEVIGTIGDFLKTLLALAFAQSISGDTYGLIKLLVGLVELHANGVNQEGYFTLPSLQSLVNLICSCISDQLCFGLMVACTAYLQVQRRDATPEVHPPWNAQPVHRCFWVESLLLMIRDYQLNDLTM